MKTLIIPCAAPSNGCMPIFMRKDLDGRHWIERCLDGIDIHSFERVVMTFLEEDVEMWDCLTVISSVLDSMIEFCVLDKQTNGPAATVYQTVLRMGISGSIVIKDSDCSIQSDLLPLGSDFVLGIDVESLDADVPHLKDKSFIVFNEQLQIIDIAEKQLKSSIISLGMYSFANVKDFLNAYEALDTPSYDLSSIYVSYCISYLIGLNANYFTYIEAESMKSWGSLVERRDLMAGELFGRRFGGESQMCVLVDLDGTLFNTDTVNYKAYSKALESMGYPLSYGTYLERCAGRKYTEFLLDIYPSLSSSDINSIHEEKQRVYPSFLKHALMNEVLVSFLFTLRPICKICLVTTASRRNASDLLKYFEIEELFDELVVGEDVEFGKPSPEAYLKAMSILGIKATRCVAIEDSEVGLQSARAAGLLTMIVNW